METVIKRNADGDVTGPAALVSAINNARSAARHTGDIDTAAEAAAIAGFMGGLKYASQQAYAAAYGGAGRQ